MKTTRLLILLCFAFLFAIQFSHAQETLDTSKLWRIETTDGNEYLGKILERDVNQIILQTQTVGTITIPVKNVKSMQETAPGRLINGQLWKDNPQSTRYFWSPNGYGLQKGEGYYQNVWVLFNQASVGITDHVSVGLGMVPLFLFEGSATPFWITPKVSIPIKKESFNIGAGVLLGTVIGDESGVFGIAYGTTTFGNRDKNLTLGLGYGFADGEWASRPAISISGMLRISRRGYLITENYIIEDVGIIMLGGRTVWNSLSLDYGILVPVGSDGFIGIPWLGLVVPFGKKN